ncbi:hypothetical protein B879_00500 [Cecembia lonarensis LW9]|uniref:Uncharacterized protein n=1 Tax=Cecembia lonarensis (strain CCUG 58316 / KCTC 22772 / LW9) TaxID=1225176 RepID=K1L333_CECL9|nr:hypothetical protein B879_00500 [Cecembia lonarensis LW9]
MLDMKIKKVYVYSKNKHLLTLVFKYLERIDRKRRIGEFLLTA